MRISSTLVTITLVTLGTAMVLPAVGALDIGCVRADARGHVDVTTLPAGTATLFTPPGADVTGWTPECVIIPNGGDITWTQRDAIGHSAVSDAECFSFPAMSALGGTPASAARAQTTLKLDFIADEGIAYTTSNGEDIGACTQFTVEGNTLVIPYHCIIHGAGMPGKIIVEL